MQISFDFVGDEVETAADIVVVDVVVVVVVGIVVVVVVCAVVAVEDAVLKVRREIDEDQIFLN